MEVFLDQMEPLRRCTEEAAMGPALGKRTHQRPAWRALSPQAAKTESGIALSCQVVAGQLLGDLDGVERRALAQIV